MIARRDFWYDPAVFLMSGDLGCHFACKQLVAGTISAQNRYCGLVTRGLQGQYCHDLIVGQALRLPNSATERGCPTFRATESLFLYRFRLWRALLCVNHHAFECIDG